jgi:peptide/nickel transport system substrate-binding protein
MRRLFLFLALGAFVLAPLLAAAQPAGRVVIAQGVDPTTLDPQNHEETPAYNVLLNLYDTLLFRDKDLKIIPWIAESWRVVNPTTWEFKIRKGAKFHNGEEVDAEAVKFSLERLINPDLKMRQAPNFTLIDKIEAPDKSTVRVITKKPFPTLENQLALRGAIVPPKYFKENPRAHYAGRRAPGRRGGHRHQRAATPREAGRSRRQALRVQGPERPHNLPLDLHAQIRQGPQARWPV